MTTNRGPSPWLMLAALAAVVAVAAALGAVQSPSGAEQARQGLHSAAQATLRASGYTEDFKQTVPQGTEELHLVYQAPGRLSGYQLIAGRRLYVSADSSRFYQGIAGPSASGPAGARYVAQPSRPAAAIDPVQQVLGVVLRATDVKRAGNVYSFVVPGFGRFSVTVTGPYATSVVLHTAGGSIALDVSRIDSSPPAFVPSGSLLVG